MAKIKVHAGDFHKNAPNSYYFGLLGLTPLSS